MFKYNAIYHRCFMLTLMCLLASCASLPPMEDPTVTLQSIEPVKGQGFSPKFKLNLLVTNPNDQDIELDGVSFKLAIKDQTLLSGVSNDLPVLGAYQETALSVEASVNFLEMIGLIRKFQSASDQNINYTLTTKIDPKGVLPAFTRTQEGQLKDMMEQMTQ